MNKNRHVVVNIWTSKDNEALQGANVGHVSLVTPYEYISLWPGKRSDTRHQTDFFQKAEDKLHKAFINFSKRPTSYKIDYEQDCLFEAASERHYREVKDASELREGETLYKFDSDAFTFERITEIGFGKETDKILAIKLLPATFRMVLYSLNDEKVETTFHFLKKAILGWSLAGSNILTRNLNEETTENCASLAYRCLSAGGLYDELDSQLSCQMSSAVTPDDLLRHIVAAKERELKENPEIATWKLEGVDETSLAELKKLYENKGLHANAEEDILPAIKPSQVSCIML